ncbi:unnamed protein product [Ilex paraguariensis]
MELETSSVKVFMAELVAIVLAAIIDVLHMIICNKVEERISKARLRYGTRILFIYVCSHAFAHIIAKGNMFVVVALSAMSIIVTSSFKGAATFRDSVVIARWVMVQSMITAFILILKGMLMAAIITIFPALTAVFAMRCFKSKNLPVGAKTE